MTGTAIGLFVGEPLLALPLALASHYLCDMIPHFAANDPDKAIKTRLFKNYLFVEAGLCCLLVVVLFVIQPANWLLAAACAFLAAAPDFLWINKFLTIRRGRKWQPGTWSRFAGRIQWFQRPIGAPIEVVWFIATLSLIAPFLH